MFNTDNRTPNARAVPSFRHALGRDPLALSPLDSGQNRAGMTDAEISLFSSHRPGY